MSLRPFKFILPLFACITACSSAPEKTVATVDTIYVGDNIITMDESTAEAVAIVGDRILATGMRDEILSMQSGTTKIIELGERALLPGFIDAHGHVSGVGRVTALLDLSPPPVGSVVTIDDIVEIIQQYIAAENPAPGTWIYGRGYDDSLLTEGRHPNRADLDRASLEHPIVLTHVSGHLAAGNSAALGLAKVTASTTNPAGGVIRRRADQEPDGVMEETAQRLYPSIKMEASRRGELLRVGLEIYASYGVTTAQDGGVSLAYVDQLRNESATLPFPIDMVAFVEVNTVDDATVDSIEVDTNYTNGFRLGGVKFWLDGSPQGRTAWLSEPYTQGPPGQATDYVAYPTFDPDTYKARMLRLLERKVPVLAHANGDAAIELMIDGVADAVDTLKISDHRSVAIHSQLMRRDQLDRVKSLGIVPSYYAAHPFFWGDWHRLSFGEERAAFISPAQASIDRGIPFTIHNDSPVVPPNVMRLIWIAVNRFTRSGHVLGPDQRISVYDALYAVTQGAAFQYFEEDNKGSITAGKQADFVILGENPLKAEPETLKDIPIIETIARGQTVYRRD